MKFSASMLKSYMACPLQAKFNYLEGRSEKQNAWASFGSCVHAALEQYNEGLDIDSAVEYFLYLWDHPETIGVQWEYTPPRFSFGTQREKGVTMIRRYHEQAEWTARTVIATEHRFCVPFGEHQLSGIVDILEYQKSSDLVKIIDLKTGKRPSIANLHLDIQFTAYVYASTKREFWVGNGEDKYPGLPNGEELYERLRESQRKAFWWDLRDGKEFDTGKRDDVDYMRLYRCCEEIAKAVEHDVFVPCISGDTCGYCSYTDQCSVYVPVEISGKKII